MKLYATTCIKEHFFKDDILKNVFCLRFNTKPNFFQPK